MYNIGDIVVRDGRRSKYNGKYFQLMCTIEICPNFSTPCFDICREHGGYVRCLEPGCEGPKQDINGYCKRHGGVQCRKDKCKETRSCGTDHCREHATEDEVYKILANQCRSMDKRKGKTTKLSDSDIKYIVECQEYKCHWCCREFKIVMGEKHIDQLSFDKIDTQKYHSVDNIVATCLFCNRARNQSSTEDWTEYIKVLLGLLKQEVKEYIPSKALLKRCINDNKKKDKQKNREFDLTREWLINQFINQNGKSYYTGILMYEGDNGYYPFKPSVERLDNSKGHTQDNCVLVCLAENIGKSCTDTTEFMKWLENNFDTSIHKLENTIDKQKITYFKKLHKFDIETGETIKIYNSEAEAKKETGIKNISRATRMNMNAGGYGWKYVSYF